MSTIKKFSSVVLSATTVMWLTGSGVLMPIAHGATVEELQAQIQALLAQIQSLQSQLSVAQGSATPSFNYTRDLTVGSKGDDVKALQEFLMAKGFLKIAAATGFFGSLTKAALVAFQKSVGISPASGFFGPKTRAYIASLAAAPSQQQQQQQQQAPSGLTVILAPDQPAPALFPKNASSVPFTKLVFTAGGSDVTVDSVTVERKGSASNAAFSGVILLDENGVRIGNSKTFSSDNRAILSDDFVVKAGQSKSIVVAGDAVADETSYIGQLASLAVVDVKTLGGVPVNASYPMVGATHTVNNSLTIGSLTLTRGSFDPGSSQTKEVGTQNYIFSSLKLTAGSAEKVLLKSIRWYQAGSAGATDIDNVKVLVDGASYDTSVSADGKYYTAVFGSGIEIDKGFNKEVSIRGDLKGGSDRTVNFDLFRYSDIQAKGLTYGYDILPSATEVAASPDDGNFHSSNPNFDAFKLTIGAGSMQVAASAKVPAQNIAINVANQVLGAFDVIVKGEPITVAGFKFRVSMWAGTGGTASTQDITNVTLVDENNNIVAGPVDITPTSPEIAFTDTVTFPVGTHTYTLKGKLGTDFKNGDTVAASTTPSSWTTPKGVVTNVSITPTPSSAITSNTMTVKAAALAVSVSPNPPAQTIVAGLKGFTFANYVLDATASGEDLRITQIQPQINLGQSNSADDLTNCQMFDGSTPLNTGSNIVNPADADASGKDYSVNFDSPLIVSKGTVKTLTWKCDTTATTTTPASSYTFKWNIEGVDANVAVSGVTSGQSVAETYPAGTIAGQVITLTKGGSLVVALDASSPAVRLGLANTVDNVLSVLRLTATTEPINVTQIGLQLGGVASNTPQDLVKVTLWDGSTKVGEGVFSSDFATVTVSGLTVPANSDKAVTIKGDFAAIGTSDPARPGHRVRVEYDGDAADSAGNATRGVGASSGVTIYATGSDTASQGVIIYKATPKVAKLSLPSTKLVNATIPLYRFSVTAPSTGSVGLYKFSFKVATSTQGVPTFAVTSLQVRGYSDAAFSQPAYANSGLLNSAAMGAKFAGSDIWEIYFDPIGQAGTKEAIQVPAGATRYFELTGTVANMSATSSSVMVDLEGDASNGSAPDSADNWLGSSAGNYAFATTAAVVDSYADNDFIWSGNSTTTSGVGHYDWSNGFVVEGLPSTNLTAEVLTP